MSSDSVATKTQRLLDLIAFLVARRYPVSVEQIMEGIPGYAERWVDGSEAQRDSVRRMFERDKSELRQLGIPMDPASRWIGADRTEGYVLRAQDFFLPCLRLLARSEEEREDSARARPRGGSPTAFEITDGEARAALDGLRHLTDLPHFPLFREARSAFRKLAFDLDPGRFSETPMLLVDPPGTPDVGEVLQILTGALLTRKRVSFEYHGIGRDEVTTRDVEPYGLLYQGSHWYLVGRDRDRDGLRTFRIGRMSKAIRNERGKNSPDYEVPEGFDLGDHAGRRPWELQGDTGPRRVRVRFDLPRALWAGRNGYGEAVDEAVDGSAIRSFEVSNDDAFIRWILGMAGEAEIQLPAELRVEVEQRAGRVAALHTDGAR